MSPEEWVGRNGHKLVLAGPLAERYDDPAVDRWCREVMRILMDLPLRQALHEKYLTPEECAYADRGLVLDPATGKAYDPCS
jgi:hypothetical protein